VTTNTTNNVIIVINVGAVLVLSTPFLGVPPLLFLGLNAHQCKAQPHDGRPFCGLGD